MDLSVIIASTRPELLKNCLEGFAKQSSNYNFEVIASGKVSGIYSIGNNVLLLSVEELHPNIKRNKACALAKSELIALMDDDAIPHEHWVEQAVTFARQHPGYVITGPELPYTNSRNFAVLSHQILSSSVAEFTKGHISNRMEEVMWYDVPFCNCVFPKEIWRRRNGFDETILWHMDDFHFFFPLRKNVKFINNAAMQIFHNRYRDSLLQLVKYKWRIRRESGEKLILHHDIYWSVGPIRLAVITSMFAAFFLVLFLFINPLISAGIIGVYCLFAISIVISIVGFKPQNILNGFSILVAVHITSITALYFGIIRAFLTSYTKGTLK